ncbi:hypothetical protein C8F04DRAFT_157650 [Mycena alexandri]|uniref:Uncharacterized protein n=1 Tax=Mycena alexandri TaxID=1745969 RepID=A0AAD6XAK4_9AGAR|nr:hypothetical protein C8F04DRAFT_157650 [Mycena alexandri]
MSVRATLVHALTQAQVLLSTSCGLLERVIKYCLQFLVLGCRNMPQNVSAQHSGISMARSYDSGSCSPPSNGSSSWEWGSPIKATRRARA